MSCERILFSASSISQSLNPWSSMESQSLLWSEKKMKIFDISTFWKFKFVLSDFDCQGIAMSGVKNNWREFIINLNVQWVNCHCCLHQLNEYWNYAISSQNFSFLKKEMRQQRNVLPLLHFPFPPTYVEMCQLTYSIKDSLSHCRECYWFKLFEKICFSIPKMVIIRSTSTHVCYTKENEQDRTL